MAVGIIAEYNPFHNGHLYHLEKVKQLFKDEVIVLVLSGNFTQRGEPSIIDKWKKKDIALLAGIDLVVELPFTFATQSADFFSYGALTILEKLKVDKIVFGSECDNIEDLTTIAKCQISNTDCDQLVKIYSKLGQNYPTALANAVYDLTNKKITTPNDLLGVSYIKTILKYNYKIKPICIKRTNDYHSKELTKISSATAIREALKRNEDVKATIPNFVMPYLTNLHFVDDYFKLLKYKILTEDDLAKYQTVDEGLDQKLKSVIKNCNSYDELVTKLKSKRYTYNKIARMLLHILVNFTKDLGKNMQEISYIRILGFNEKGQDYLHSIKKNIDIKLLSKYEKDYCQMLNFELQTTEIYDLIYNENLVKKEYTNQLGKEIYYDKN